MILVLDEKLKNYSFPEHPFNNSRYTKFVEEFEKLDKDLKEKIKIIKARKARLKELLLFHTKKYIDFVKEKSKKGVGFLDYGDTPAFKGCYEACCYVVGGVLNAIDNMIKEKDNAFVPIAGLHHAYSDRAGGFCIFNDVCIAIKYLRKKYGIDEILYFDIDAHHGDGVFYSFERDPKIKIVDFHQLLLYPGTGFANETGKGKAKGTKLNIILSPFSDDRVFVDGLKKAKEFLDKRKVDFVIFQAGADCIAGDPLSNLNLERAHELATKFLVEYAKNQNINILALGGGGYNVNNVARAWIDVIKNLVNAPGRI